ncbi:MAG: hypothetical protein U0074_02685 [Kouleothrix sp.]
MLPQLHQLYTLVAGDVSIPIHPHADAPPSWLAQQAVGLPGSLPGWFLHCARWATLRGHELLHAGLPGMHRLYQRITAIDPTYRGRGIAMALKLETIAYAQAHSYYLDLHRSWTRNATRDMLAINTKLGFEAREYLAPMIKPL